ncbi:MAG: hypothetical protein IBJ12_03185 [Sphingomonadaceae bacterium]|nr:hypothetical protein [Sphingomonadaceae bacterium]
MVIGLALFVIAATLIGALLLRLAVHALPASCAFLAAQTIYHSGAGLVAALAGAAVAAIATLALAQCLLAFVSSPATRIAIGLAFALPAGLAGYYAMRGFAVATMPVSIWQQVLPMIATATIAVTTWVRFGTAPRERH